MSDYDITDVQPRRAEEWRSVLSVFFFLFSHPSGILFRKKEGGRDRDTHTHRAREREREILNIWPKPECDSVFTQNVLQIDVFAFALLLFDMDQKIWA